MAARDARFVPLIYAYVIEVVPRLVITVVKGWEAGGSQVFLYRVINCIKVDVGLVSGVVIPKKEIGFSGLRRLRSQKVVHRNTEPLGQSKNRLMSAVDLVFTMFTHFYF